MRSVRSRHQLGSLRGPQHGSELVPVGTRTALHADLCAAALEAGKHVITEKPLAASSRDAARLLALAERAPGLVAACNYNYRAYPMVAQARLLVAAGELLFVHGSYTQDWLLSPQDYNWRLDPADSGASAARCSAFPCTSSGVSDSRRSALAFSCCS